MGKMMLSEYSGIGKILIMIRNLCYNVLINNELADNRQHRIVN